MISLTPLVPFQTALKVYASLFYHCPHQDPVFILERNGPIPVLQHTLSHTPPIHYPSWPLTSHSVEIQNRGVPTICGCMCVYVRDWMRAHACVCVCTSLNWEAQALPTSIFYFHWKKHESPNIYYSLCQPCAGTFFSHCDLSSDTVFFVKRIKGSGHRAHFY